MARDKSAADRAPMCPLCNTRHFGMDHSWPATKKKTSTKKGRTKKKAKKKR